MTNKNGRGAARTAAARTLVTGGGPDQPYPVPDEEKFKSAFGSAGRKFIESTDLEAIARALIASEPELERMTRGLVIRYLWKAEGGARHGAPTLGKCVKPSGLVRHFSDADFVIWLAADHLRELNGVNGAATRFQVEACLYHELKHIGVEIDEENGDEKPVLRPHDLEEFNSVILRYGAWDEAVELTAAAFTQMPLWADSAASEAAASPGVRAAVGKFVDAAQAMCEDPKSGITEISVGAGGRTATVAKSSRGKKGTNE